MLLLEALGRAEGRAATDDGLDGLRALCAAHWSRHPADGAPADVVAAGPRAQEALRRWGLASAARNAG
ncbi:hypothetical protein [Blastococcus brunescens]|uniref:GCN5-related N-acetyltransferase-like domain-containing protein n=1 Tax=Blastococcus brunescens TaxID=1564165 RepID=A0ABZ1B678_9ACTN|nr:hypothetical protein [Blastococcus sp. BMG 8361]WRL66320.1 hypothetical protein U6N30_13270 [Blastococcus sp. BMG 8361]